MSRKIQNQIEHKISILQLHFHVLRLEINTGSNYLPLPFEEICHLDLNEL